MIPKNSNHFFGVIIEESLEKKDVLKDVKIIKTKVESVVKEHKTPWLKQWTLHTVEIPAEQVEKIAKEVCSSLDSEHNWYADFKNEKFHYILFRNKVFRINRKSKAEYNGAMRYGLSLGIPEYQLIFFPGTAIDVLTNFLREANKNTYANVNAKKAPSTRLHSADYHFEQDDLIYHDTYFGSRDFIGEEIIYDAGRPVWGANYFGFILDENLNEKVLYDFLRKALMHNSGDLIPVRGPRAYKRGLWKYAFIVTGDLSNFTGNEEISYRGKIVYRLFMHGGFIG